MDETSKGWQRIPVAAAAAAARGRRLKSTEISSHSQRPAVDTSSEVEMAIGPRSTGEPGHSEVWEGGWRSLLRDF